MVKIELDNCTLEYEIGDSPELMNALPDKSIDLVVTSPPYDNLRDYGGYVFDFEGIAKQLYRVLKDGGVVVWVVKDSVKDGNRSLTSYRQAIYFQDIGFNMFDVIIYSKLGSSLPHNNRYSDTFEYMFILSKGKPKTINLIRDKVNKWAGTSGFGTKRVREKDGRLTDRKRGKISKKSRRYNVWEYNTGFGNTTTDKVAFEHPALFPDSLAKDHIISWSNEGDVVLDPFLGSGTTMKMCRLTGRNCIGYEINPDYEPIIRKRIMADTKSLFSFGGD